MRLPHERPHAHREGRNPQLASSEKMCSMPTPCFRYNVDLCCHSLCFLEDAAWTPLQQYLFLSFACRKLRVLVPCCMSWYVVCIPHPLPTRYFQGAHSRDRLRFPRTGYRPFDSINDEVEKDHACSGVLCLVSGEHVRAKNIPAKEGHGHVFEFLKILSTQQTHLARSNPAACSDPLTGMTACSESFLTCIVSPSAMAAPDEL